MSWSLKIGSIAGTAIRIHITFILFLAWIFGASYVSRGPNAAWSSLLFMVLLFLCVLAHEFGHILAARAFGVLTSDVILLPIGGVSRLERIPDVVIAFGLVLVTSATLDSGSLATVESAKVSMVDRLASVNFPRAL
ncbi:MAG: site-2 protease family protein [Bradyrhizobium sp.]|nr:site-2 protease family protein [Bradyrhizobium sp.]